MILWYRITSRTQNGSISTDSSGRRIDDRIHIQFLLDTSANMTQGTCSGDIQIYIICEYCVCSVEHL